MNAKGNTSLARKILVYLFVASTSVAAVITLVTSFVDYRQQSQELENTTVQLQDLASRGVAALLWNRDLESIENQLRSILGNPAVHSVEVWDEQKNSVFKASSTLTTHPVYTFTQNAPVIYNDGTEKKIIGSISFTMSKDRVINDVASRFLLVLILNGIKAVLVSTFMYMILKRLLIIPIQDLVAYFRKNPLPVAGDIRLNFGDRKTKPDEWSELVDFVNQRENSLEALHNQNLSTISTQAQTIEVAKEEIQLEKAKVEFSARMAEVGRMAAGIAHEINNPLAIITGNLSRLKSLLGAAKELDARIFELIEKIEKCGFRIAKITRALLLYSHQDQEMAYKLVSIEDLLGKAINLSQGRFSAAGRKLSFRDEDLKLTTQQVSIECCESQILQVLVILINNSFDAIKDQPEGWAELGAKVEGDRVLFTVTDSGAGISEDIAQKIFTPFFTTKALGEGTGLGLSIAFGVIKAHLGEIQLNRQAKGTQFVVMLPLTHTQSHKLVA